MHGGGGPKLNIPESLPSGGGSIFKRDGSARGRNRVADVGRAAKGAVPPAPSFKIFLPKNVVRMRRQTTALRKLQARKSRVRTILVTNRILGL